MMRRIIAQLAKDKAAYAEQIKKRDEAFTQGYALYKKITASPESKKAATEEELKRAMDLLEQGKHSPDSGGEKGAYRKYLNELGRLVDSRKKPDV